MTRGKLILFLPNKILSSTEFNGDMYYQNDETYISNGVLAGELIQDVCTEDDLVAASIRINKEYGYPKDEMRAYDATLKYDWQLHTYGYYRYNDMLYLKDDYFEKYSSDYIFVKNMSGHALDFYCDYDTVFRLENGDAGIFHFYDLAIDFPREMNHATCIKMPSIVGQFSRQNSRNFIMN